MNPEPGTYDYEVNRAKIDAMIFSNEPCIYCGLGVTQQEQGRTGERAHVRCLPKFQPEA